MKGAKIKKQFIRVCHCEFRYGNIRLVIGSREKSCSAAAAIKLSYLGHAWEARGRSEQKEHAKRWKKVEKVVGGGETTRSRWKKEEKGQGTQVEHERGKLNARRALQLQLEKPFVTARSRCKAYTKVVRQSCRFGLPAWILTLLRVRDYRVIC